jgi:Leucine-rich repeat (LRR) protein
MGKSLSLAAREGTLEISNVSLDVVKFDPKLNPVKIKFTTNDTCIVYCGIYDSNNNEVAVVSNGGSIPNAGGWSLTWKGVNSSGNYVAPGIYTVAIGLANDAGEESEKIFKTVEVAASATNDNANTNVNSAPVLSNLTLSIAKLRPGTDKVKITFRNDKACKAYCDVYDKNNVKVATVAKGGNLPNVSNWFYNWSGIGTNGKYLAQGIYSIKVALTNEYGKSKILSKNIEILASSTNSGSGVGGTSSSTVIKFKDRNLETSIRNIIEKPTGDILYSDVKNIKTLELATVLGISNLSGMEYFTNLIYLDLGKNNDANDISDLSPLKGLKNLQQLYLNFNKISDLSPLSGLTNLRTLEAGGNKIVNIAPLKTLTNLKALYLGIAYNDGGNAIQDLSPISGLVNLTELGLYGNNVVKNIEVISGMTRMLRLNVRGVPVSNLNFVKGMTNLQMLDVGGSKNRVTSLEPIRQLTNLKELGLDGNRISNLKPIEGLTNLKTLCFAGNMVTSLESLKMFPNLTTLKVGTGCAGGNPITNYSMIGSLKNLEHLEVACSELKNIDFVRGLTKLKYLDAQYNELTNVNALSGLTNLEDLTLNKNKISDISGISNKTKLTYLMLNDNNISDIEALRNSTKLNVLHLGNNNISDFSPVEGYYNDIYNKDFKLQ